MSAAATIDLASCVGVVDQARADRLRRPRSRSSAPTKLAVGRHQDRVLGPEGPRRDRRRDRVRGVVEAVDVVEDDRQAEDERAGSKRSTPRRARPEATAGCDGVGRRAAPPRPVAPRVAGILRAHAPVPAVLHDPPRRPRRRRDAVAPPAAAGRLRPPARLRDLLAAAARQAGQRPGRAGHPRGAGPRSAARRWRCRSSIPADVWRASGRYDAIGPELAPVQGPQRPRHGPRDDPRGGRRAPARATSSSRYRQLPMHGLPLPDEVARRAARPRRPDPRPRVRHEGRLQLRPRRGRASTPATRRSTAPTSGSSSGSGSTTIAVGVRRRDDGRQPGPRVHGPQPGRRGRPRPVRGVRLRRQPAGRGHRASPTPAAEDAAAARGGRDARHDDDRDARRVPRHRRRRGRPRPPSS